jgi:hypothetical protein
MPNIYELMKNSRYLVYVLSVYILTFDEPTRCLVMLLLKLRKTKSNSENSEMQAAQDKSLERTRWIFGRGLGMWISDSVSIFCNVCCLSTF